MYDIEDEVPDEAYTNPFGEANITREGGDVTIVAFSRMVLMANEARTGWRVRAFMRLSSTRARHRRSMPTRFSTASERRGGSSSSMRVIRAAALPPMSRHLSRSAAFIR